MPQDIALIFFAGSRWIDLSEALKVFLSIAPSHLTRKTSFIHSFNYKFHVSQGRCMVCFGAALDAVRFCHAAQVALLFQRWPSDCTAVVGPTQLTPDNRPLFAGPRVAMAVHTTPAHECATASPGRC